MTKKSYFLVLVLLVLASSCSNLSEPDAARETPTSVANNMATALPILQPTQSITTLVSPEPTLNSDERDAYITLMLMDNNGCDLPCWWGIEPGKTTWASVEALLLHLNAKANKVEYGSGLVGYGTRELGLDSIGISPNVSFYVKGELVENIVISVFSNSSPEGFKQKWEYYSPDKILLKYGKPSQIKLYISTYGETDNASYQYWIYYDNLGFLITYGGGVKKQDPFHICPNFNESESNDNQISEIQIYLKPPDNELPLDAVVGDERIQLLGSTLRNVEDVTATLIDEYYNSFVSDSKNICLETPSSFWE